MEESILLSIKKLLGPSGSYTEFDPDIIMHINTYLMTLRQIGVGPAEGFIIEDDSAVWSDLVSDPVECQAVKTYLYCKVRLVFDPPQSASHIKVLEDTAKECECRLNYEVDPGEL